MVHGRLLFFSMKKTFAFRDLFDQMNQVIFVLLVLFARERAHD